MFMHEKHTTRIRYLDAMGIQLWTPRIPVQNSIPRSNRQDEITEKFPDKLILTRTESKTLEESPELYPGGHNNNQTWDRLAKEVAKCTACPLHQSRIQTVFGVGDHQANCMVIGEAPGANEDKQGEPFVGRAGLLLNEMLRALGYAREQVFIANILKCRPPNNRDPQPEEVSACEAFLKQQVMLLNPQIILAVGRIAAQNLLKTTSSIGQLRGRIHDYDNIPLVVFYHPAYLLRSPLEKRKAWDDIRLAEKVIRKN